MIKIKVITFFEKNNISMYASILNITLKVYITKHNLSTFFEKIVKLFIDKIRQFC